MAWKHERTRNKNAYVSETYTLPASAANGFSSVIDFINPERTHETNWASFKFHPSAITGDNLDIALYGSDTSAGTNKYLLLDALVADLTADDTVIAGAIDMNLYPAPYYFLAWLAPGDESANTISVSVSY
jgi:hypothetical protein